MLNLRAPRFIYLCSGSAPGFVQRVTCLAGKACTKGGLPGGGNRALGVKLANMFAIPGIAHRNAIFSLQADCAGPGDSYYPIRAFPLWRQLVGILGRLNTPKDKVAFLKASGMNLAAMVAAQGLLVACCYHSRPEDDLPQGALHHLAATALAQAHHKRALEVTRI